MADDAELLRLVQRVPLFARCREKHVRAVLRTAKERAYEPGETIIEEGQEGIAFYLVLDGEVEVRRGDETVATLTTGEHFGELALLSQEPQRRTASVVAVSETRCLLLSVWDFKGLLENNADMAMQILAGVADRLRALESSPL